MYGSAVLAAAVSSSAPMADAAAEDVMDEGCASGSSDGESCPGVVSLVCPRSMHRVIKYCCLSVC